MFVRTILSVFVLVLAACATRQSAPGVYRLIGTGPATVLLPPDVADPTLAVRTFDFPIGRRVPASCRTHDDVFRVEPHRGFLRITVQRDALVGHPGAWLVD